jgi:hypothetical protein
METEEKKLKCKMSEFKSELSFNEWAEKFNVGVGYTEPTKYFQGNPSSGIQPSKQLRYQDETLIQRMFRILFTND